MNTPVFWAEGHPGKLDRETWTLEVQGACDKPQVFSWQDLMQMQAVEVEGRLTQRHPLVSVWHLEGNPHQGDSPASSDA